MSEEKYTTIARMNGVEVIRREDGKYALRDLRGEDQETDLMFRYRTLAMAMRIAKRYSDDNDRLDGIPKKEVEIPKSKLRGKRIEIITQLDSRIDDPGAGKPVVHYSWTIGPRNLWKAMRVFPEHERKMLMSYGDIGCGGSWLEVAGVEVPVPDVRCRSWRTRNGAKVSPTRYCREIIVSCCL